MFLFLNNFFSVGDLLASSSSSTNEMKFSLLTPQQMQDNPNKMSLPTTTSTTSDFTQWLHAMKMVARLPGGMPPEFRKKLWLALSEKHLQTRKINWNLEQVKCLSEQWRTDDEELGIQIVKVRILTFSLFYKSFSHQFEALINFIRFYYLFSF